LVAFRLFYRWLRFATPLTRLVACGSPFVRFTIPFACGCRAFLPVLPSHILPAFSHLTSYAPFGCGHFTPHISGSRTSHVEPRFTGTWTTTSHIHTHALPFGPHPGCVYLFATTHHAHTFPHQFVYTTPCVHFFTFYVLASRFTSIHLRLTHHLAYTTYTISAHLHTRPRTLTHHGLPRLVVVHTFFGSRSFTYTRCSSCWTHTTTHLLPRLP